MSNTPINPLDYATPNLNRGRMSPWVGVTLAVAVLLVLKLLSETLFFPGGRATESANRRKCAYNLRQIGQSVVQYAQEHAGQYPESLGTIYLNEDIAWPAFICPSSNDIPSTKPTTREQAADIDSSSSGCCSYIYLGRGFVAGQVPPDCVIICEPLVNHRGDGMDVLFGDGHVEFIDKVHAALILRQVAAGKAVVRCPEEK